MRRTLIILVLFSLMLMGLLVAFSSATTECPRIEDLPVDPDNSYCQTGGFMMVGDKGERVTVLCDDDNFICCNFYKEKYKGERGCCTNSNCMNMNCLPRFNGGDQSFVWSYFTSSPDAWHCEGDDND